MAFGRSRERETEEGEEHRENERGQGVRGVSVAQVRTREGKQEVAGGRGRGRSRAGTQLLRGEGRKTTEGLRWSAGPVGQAACWAGQVGCQVGPGEFSLSPLFSVFYYFCNCRALLKILRHLKKILE